MMNNDTLMNGFPPTYTAPPINITQATTPLQRASDTHLIVTLDTPEGPMETPTSVTSDDNSDSNSSCSSSNWDSVSDDDVEPIPGGHSRSSSMVSSYLPRFHTKRNKQLTIASFSARLTEVVEEERAQARLCGDHRHDTDYRLLFYPHPNLQSLLFSQIHPFIENDYRNDIGNDSDDDHDDNMYKHECFMDWYDIESVNKFSGLISQLLITASYGIREDVIYLMFSSPSPLSIIMHLRFGVLSRLCDIHIDRFGRRSFYYHYPDTKQMQTPHFFQHSKLPSELDDLLNDGNLSAFIGETPPGSNAESPIKDFSLSYSPISRESTKPYLIKNYEPNVSVNASAKRLEIDDLSPIALATPLKVKNGGLGACFPDLAPIKVNTDTSINDRKALLNGIQKYLSTKKKSFVLHTLTGRLENGIKDIYHNNYTFKTQPNIKRRKKKQKTPNRALPSLPKPKISDATKMKIKARSLKSQIRNNKLYKIMNANKFKTVNLSDILYSDGDLRESFNNYDIAKGIAHYFDIIFGDTDTVVIVCGQNKDPALSYWLKGHADYIRKTHNVGMHNKTVIVYRACPHSKAKQPIRSHKEFEDYVRTICIKHKNKSVKYIGDLLDNTFGYGVHFARSTLKRCDYDIYCRYSDKYECSFKLPSGAYIVAWRR